MFKERLKSLRKEANLTQKEIAEKLNISQPQYARTENGGRTPSKETLEKLANFFDVSTDYLLGHTDIKNPEVLDFNKVKESLRQSLGYTGSSDIPEDELDSMAEAFINHFGKK